MLELELWQWLYYIVYNCTVHVCQTVLLTENVLPKSLQSLEVLAGFGENFEGQYLLQNFSFNDEAEKALT